MNQRDRPEERKTVTSSGMSPDAQSVVRTVGPFVDGVLREPESDTVVEVINPSNGKHYRLIPAGSAVDVDRAVTAARDAFDDGRWCAAPPSSRKKALHRFANLIEAEAGVLDALDAGEMGKPVSVAFCNSAAAAALMRFFAEAVDKLTGDVFNSDRNSFVTQRRVPRGVVAAIVPWNPVMWQSRSHNLR